MAIADLVLRYLQALVWPLAVLIIAVMFRGSIRAAVGRLTEVTGPGVSAKFETEAEALAAHAKEIADRQTVPSYPPYELPPPPVAPPSPWGSGYQSEPSYGPGPYGPPPYGPGPYGQESYGPGHEPPPYEPPPYGPPSYEPPPYGPPSYGPPSYGPGVEPPPYAPDSPPHNGEAPSDVPPLTFPPPPPSADESVSPPWPSSPAESPDETQGEAQPSDKPPAPPEPPGSPPAGDEGAETGPTRDLRPPPLPEPPPAPVPPPAYGPQAPAPDFQQPSQSFGPQDPLEPPPSRPSPDELRFRVRATFATARSAAESDPLAAIRTAWLDVRRAVAVLTNCTVEELTDASPPRSPSEWPIRPATADTTPEMRDLLRWMDRMREDAVARPDAVTASAAHAYVTAAEEAVFALYRATGRTP